MPRNLAFYVVVILLFGAGILGILRLGARPPAGRGPGRPGRRGRGRAGYRPRHPPASPGRVRDNLHHPLRILLLQVLVIVVAARAARARSSAASASRR